MLNYGVGMNEYETVNWMIESINWTNILGYGKKPSDVCTEIYRENKTEGPYSWELVCNIKAIAKAVEDIKSNRPTEVDGMLDGWFSRRIGSLIIKEKLEGAKPPESKGFWQRLFG